MQTTADNTCDNPKQLLWAFMGKHDMNKAATQMFASIYNIELAQEQ